MLKNKKFHWNPEKNLQLQQERGIGFDMVVQAIEENKVLEVTPHPNQEKYPSQKIVIIELNDYVNWFRLYRMGMKYSSKQLSPIAK